MLREEDIPRSSYACHHVVETGRHPVLREEDIPRSSYTCHRVVEAGRHPVLREEDTPCFARRTFRDHLTLVTFSVEGHLPKVNAW